MFRSSATWIRSCPNLCRFEGRGSSAETPARSRRRRQASTKPRWRKTAIFLTDPSGWATSTLSRTLKAYRGLIPSAFSARSSADMKYGAPPIMAEPHFSLTATAASLLAFSAISSFEGIALKVSSPRTAALSDGSTTPASTCSLVESC